MSIKDRFPLNTGSVKYRFYCTSFFVVCAPALELFQRSL
jgi:hypothetical protein